MKALLQTLITGLDLSAKDRATWRAVALIALVLGMVGLYFADAWEMVERYDLIGFALALLGSLVGLGQTMARHASRPPPLPERELTREETGQHRTIKQPSVPSEYQLPPVLELTEEDIDTERPPPLDDDHDTDPQTPEAKRRKEN